MSAAPTQSRSTSRASAPLVAQVGLLAGPFLNMVDASIVNVALPAIARQLHTALDTAQWVLSGYLLALAAGLAASAYLAKRFGTRRVYLASLLGFTLASVLCALAPSIGLLIAARAVQGLLGAPLVPLAMTMLLGGEGARMPPAAGVVLFLAPALGPTLGGLLLQVAGWPLIFLVNLPVGLVGALAGARMPAPAGERGDPAARFDPLGLLLLAGGLVAAIYGGTQGPQRGWGSPAAWPYLAGGVTLLGAYTLWALRRPHPAVDLRLLRQPQTALAVGLSTLVAIVLFGIVFLLPLFLEDLQGLSALQAGLTLLPQGLVTGVGIGLGAPLAARLGVRATALLGLGLLVLGTATLLRVTTTTPAWVTALILCGRGLASGLTIQPVLTVMIGGLTPAEVPDGNTLFNVAQRLGGSLGIPLLGTFFALREQVRVDAALRALGLPVASGGRAGLGTGGTHLPAPVRAQLTQAAVAGFHDTIWLLVAVAALGVGAALLLRDRAPTPMASPPTAE